ncbi:MAG: hypothetical protein CMN32_14150 [Saprospirales bacterium]|nr:hypothetical protein [Saprospirales bacterium]
MVIMKQLLLSLFLVASTGLFAQTTILDFESPMTSTTYQYFGSSLEGTLNNIIANPDPSGINTSAMVADHVKPAGAQTWAGAFPNPALQIPADMTSDNQVCIKVWFPAPGNVGIKLEGSSTGPNWLNTVDVTEAQTWTEVCVDVNTPSIEAPNEPAFGHVYPTVTLFFDFGTSPAEDVTYYWDDLTTQSGGGVTDGDITFSVDMNNYTGTFTTVYVSGTMNGWSGDGNPLSDPDGDGIWTGTIVDIPLGVQEFKFTVDNWAAQEDFGGKSYTCTITDPSGQFTNRKLVVAGDMELPTVCWNSCYACGEAVNITVDLGASHITVDPAGMFIAGGGNFGNPGDFPLLDADGDQVYSRTFERPKNFESFFTFTNGACPDYSCKEDIAGQDCANPGNFNDRHMGPVTQDTTIATCFGICTTDTDCGGGPMEVNVTFSVDMNDYTDPFTTVYIAGEFNGWSGDANALTDADGDGVWETTLALFPNDYEYKFELDNWAVPEEFMDGDPCTVTDPSGQFVNRIISVAGDTSVCYIWNSCDACETNATRDLVYDATLFSVNPTLVNQFTTVRFDANIAEEKVLRLLNATGMVIREMTVAPGQSDVELDTSTLPAGLYLIHVQTDQRMATARVVKQ